MILIFEAIGWGTLLPWGVAIANRTRNITNAKPGAWRLECRRWKASRAMDHRMATRVFARYVDYVVLEHVLSRMPIVEEKLQQVTATSFVKGCQHVSTTCLGFLWFSHVVPSGLSKSFTFGPFGVVNLVNTFDPDKWVATGRWNLRRSPGSAP